MMVGARELAEHERIEPIGLPAGDAEPTNSPSGRSIATNTTSIRTSVRHNADSPFSSCANVAAIT
jgi:hypothetical protein